MNTIITNAGQSPAISETASVKEIKRLHRGIIQAARTSLDSAIRIGELLNRIRTKNPHGKWLPWVEKNLPFAERTAQNYMRCFEEKDRLKSATVADLPLSVSSALALLAAPETTPADPLDIPLSEAEAGHFCQTGLGRSLSWDDFPWLVHLEVNFVRPGKPMSGRLILDTVKRFASRAEAERAAA